MRLFLEKLLMTPLLPMETLIDNKGSSWVLLYVQGKFFYYSSSNLTILDTILPYIEKSAFRKIICYEPYQLYEYFFPAASLWHNPVQHPAWNGFRLFPGFMEM